MTVLCRREPGMAASSFTGTISETVRVAPIGKADEGAIDSAGVESGIVMNNSMNCVTFSDAIYRHVVRRNDDAAGCKMLFQGALSARSSFDHQAKALGRRESLAVHIVMHLISLNA